MQPARCGNVRGGSSPHTWGTPDWARSSWLGRRFIPTHVGNTCQSHKFFLIESVHPHTRGEHVMYQAERAKINGSSPHTWGTLSVHDSAINSLRFIPTHVGNTCKFITCIDFNPVHPHTRGEHATAGPLTRRVSGSSPHTWGTLVVPTSRRQPWRFIPTHVGNTPVVGETPITMPVHPHTRGEHTNLNILIFKDKNSL
ncbi:Domain of uncharacterised function (DUF2825) [Chromobacterium vaccinii]|nr:Domain of uncharacterised function (DUF2825) [Chromobacterium vaccinii]